MCASRMPTWGISLVHMNGRVQDPVIGRFVSADPFRMASSRYSYVDDRPLSAVDPSGFRPAVAGSRVNRLQDGNYVLNRSTGSLWDSTIASSTALSMVRGYQWGEHLRSGGTCGCHIPSNGQVSGDDLDAPDPNDTLTAGSGDDSASGGSEEDTSGWFERLFRGLRRVIGKIWALPNSIVGGALGLIGHVTQTIAYELGWTNNQPYFLGWNSDANAFEFANNWIAGTAITFGNVIIYSPAFKPENYRSHESRHTYQAQLLGPAYLVGQVIGYSLGTAEATIRWSVGDREFSGVYYFSFINLAHDLSMLERGPNSEPSRPWTGPCGSINSCAE
jgi:hypothetical protein